jgi:hypothetical protein
VGIGISLAIFRRFWAVAARMNSSRAPFGPRKRSDRGLSQSSRRFGVPRKVSIARDSPVVDMEVVGRGSR